MRIVLSTRAAFKSRPYLRYPLTMSGSSFSQTTKLPPTTEAVTGFSLRFDNTFTRDLPGDLLVPTSPYDMLADNSEYEIPVPQSRFRASRQVRGALWSWAVPIDHENPRLAGVSPSGAQLIGLTSDEFWRDPLLAAAVWSGNQRMRGSHPWAHCYGGHQFGVWADQLGDGRAISLGQVRNPDTTNTWEVQLKGAGRTPYSRFADGYAVRRSSIREYLAAEHMSALGVPTSRSLALVFTDRVIEREEPELGAVVTRLAPSWVRFGSFELPASRNDFALVRKLADYVIQHHFPELTHPADDVGGGGGVYIRLLQAVVERTAAMVAAWQAVGFCHGVMNTDNMSILGLTIDYGPYAFLDAYDPEFICNHSDPAGRYAFSEQPRVALWNLVRLAGPLSRIVGPDPEVDASAETLNAVTKALNSFSAEFSRKYVEIMRRKFGLSSTGNADLATVVQPYLDLLERAHTDYTFAMRALCDVPLTLLNKDDGELEQHIDALAARSDCSRVDKEWRADMRAFYEGVYGPRLAAQGVIDHDSATALGAGMRLANPRHVLRNWVAQDIIDHADKNDDVRYVDQALELLTTHAFSDNVPEHLKDMAERYAGPVPQWGEGLQCSCSS